MIENQNSPQFIHLRVHSEFSMVNGIVRLKPLVERCAALKMPAVAVTDQGNFCGLVRFYRAANATGVKPIVGVDAWVHDESMGDEPFRMVFLCQNQIGYRHLTELISDSYLKGQQRGFPVIESSWIAQKTEGIICLSGGKEGDIGLCLKNANPALAAQRLAYWNGLFPRRFYLELQRTGRVGEEEYIHAVVGMAQGSKTPVVATNDVHFIQQQDFDAHEARVCINQGRVIDDPTRPKAFSDEQYLRSEAEMCALFQDIPEALVNSVEIAKRCNIELSLGKACLPDFPIPAGITVEEYFIKVSTEGLEKRLQVLLDESSLEYPEKRKVYDERLKTEIDVILQMGFPGYFLIVADFIQWSKDNGIPVGPGRGSGAGSLVAYALKITDLDPLAYDLLFERFLNPERVSMPDFDIDFCMDGRDRVIDYVAEKYGRDAVSQIITFGTMAAKAVIRDVGRVLGKPYGFCDRLSKMIPLDLKMTLNKAYEQEELIREAYEKDEEVREVWDLSLKLEGITRNAGKHAGGVVIAPTKLTDFTPIYCDETGSNLVAQFDKDDVEAAGLVKFDFLGLRTLTIIDWALKTINAQRKLDNLEPIDISKISLEDELTYHLLQQGNTTSVFQLESGGMKKLIKQLKPSTFEDIVALVALYRPGPLGAGMDQDFVNRKHGIEKVEYPHESLEEILKPTYGTILYQEQVMQIAQVLAGYSLGGADILRRAMGKKKAEVMEQQKRIFIDGASAKGIPEEQSGHIFSVIEKFADYGFNKSHSAAYALVSYQTAWLKCHYPAAFIAAVMSADMDNTDKVVTYVEDAREQGLKLTPPDINHGQYQFTIQGSDTIIYGIGAIKGVGQGAIESIVMEREANGPYQDLYDFCVRIDLKKANRRVLEALIKAGALDNFNLHRANLMANLEDAIKSAEQVGRDRLAGQNDLFGGAVTPQASNKMTKSVRSWPENTQLQHEKDVLGLFLSGHPFDKYQRELRQITGNKIRDLQANRRGQTSTIAGLIIGMRIITTKSGARIAIATLDDKTGRIDLAIYQDIYDECSSILAKDNVIIAEGEISVDHFSDGLKMKAKTLYDVTQIREKRLRCLQIDLKQSHLDSKFSDLLMKHLSPFKGGTTPISIQFKASGAEAMIDLGAEWKVSPSDELIYRLEDIVGDGNVHCVYT
ncbi:MAG: DNA polymerase III subunit alpha [Gammaproteobacteria bacterium CG22_combo_CG10-13_8_21_14_all_40_8]|nr:MAG: DNA polymerase III subunit alpha [Gammaproteobacteria bacterium CG22_combo_CG10-13_8_21_14_all_40_8]